MAATFSSATLRFLRDLEANNDREWFQARKEQYEKVVREPMLAAVAAVNRELARFAPDYVTDPAKAVYRVYRDTRFSKDKTPYKTHVGALMWHQRLGKSGGAAFYFHLSTKEFLMAGGLYHCEPHLLLAVREHIAEHHERLRAILRRKAVQSLLGELQGDRLSRPPKGWGTDHPAADLLRYKDLLLETTLRAGEALKPSAINEVVSRFRAMAPMLEFLNEPLLGIAARQKDPLMISDLL
jgi:uncharacterized protein (TIGR02453 family)